MSSDLTSKEKLTALYRSYEVNEKKILAEHIKIEEIYLSRKNNYDLLLSEQNSIKTTLLDLRTSKRSSAFLAGDMQKLSLFLEKEKKLEKKLKELEEQIEESSKDLLKAEERVEDSKEELLKARVEKKRIEKFLENKEDLSRSLNNASDEIYLEELNYSRRNKGK